MEAQRKRDEALACIGAPCVCARTRPEAELITRVDYGEASDVVGHLEEGAASILAGVDAFEACFDAGDADLAHLVGVSFLGVRVCEEILPIGNLLRNPGPEERGQFW